jgi:hypothetical protein
MTHPSPRQSPHPGHQPETGPGEALRVACAQVGLDPAEAEVVRVAENALYRLPGGVVARVSRPGQLDTARREVMVSEWLQRQDFPVVQALAGLPQPIEVAARAVTFWRELPPHTRSGPREIGAVLRRLRGRANRRVRSASGGPGGCIARRRREAPWSWASTDDTAAGGAPPRTGLLARPLSHTSYGLLPADRYSELVAAYGRDVTAWQGFPLLRNIRELRVTTYAGQVALDHPEAVDQAVHRLRCLQGRHGDRPWPGWRAVP